MNTSRHLPRARTKAIIQGSCAAHGGVERTGFRVSGSGSRDQASVPLEPRTPKPGSLSSASGFTLIELLTSLAILAILSSLLFAAFSQASKAWLLGESRVETFTQARAALDFMSRELSQAIVNPSVSFLGTNYAVAFVAPVANGPGDDVDIEEVVYRLSDSSAFTGAGDPSQVFVDSRPPMRLVRRISANRSINPVSTPPAYCQQYYGPGLALPLADAWNFYFDLYNWPETSDPTRTAVLADRILSLQFTFIATNGFEYLYWNSIKNANARAWRNEINPLAGPRSGIGYDEPAWRTPFAVIGSNGAEFMSNRPPAIVTISIEVVDARTIARLNSVPYPSTTWQNIRRESSRFFTTSVSIPYRN